MDNLFFARPFRFAMSTCAAALIFAGPADVAAQWPTQYTDAKQLASGANLRAADVMALPDGDVIVVNAAIVDNNLETLAARYTPDGVTKWKGQKIHSSSDLKTASIKLFPHEDPQIFATFSILADPVQMDSATETVASSASYLSSGFWTSSNSVSNFNVGKTAVSLKNRQLLRVLHNSTSNTLGIWTHGYGNVRTDIAPGVLTDFASEVSNDNRAILSYTHSALMKETASRVMYGSISPTGFAAAPEQVADQGAESQSASQVTKYNNNYMITWLGNLDGKKRLYSKVVNIDAQSVQPARLLLNDVINYRCIPSTLGAPVIAGVTRTVSGLTPSDTLFVGLLDPANANAITLPLLQGFGYKVKAIRQETNGDFTLVYSALENNTNLLKVRRISIATLGTQWETVVADLGNAPDGFIEEYPNTWLSPTSDGSLYIATRYDELYSENTKLSLVRLRSDGWLGGADDVQKPTDFTAAVSSDGHVQLTWKDNSPAETSYLVGRTQTDFDSIELTGVLPPDSQAFTDTTASPGVTYKYYVSPFIEATGALALSDERVVTVPNL